MSQPSKRQLARTVAKETGLTQVQALAVTEALLEAMSKAIVEHERLELRNFGIFEVAQQGKRKLKHPVTGEPVLVPAQKVVRFRASKALKQSLNSSDWDKLLEMTNEFEQELLKPL